MSRWIETGRSQLEGGAIALYIKPEVNSPTAKRICCPRSPREVFHSHDSTDGSSHAYLTATDAALVIERGWGERHGLSGRALGLPLNYTMIFAPRDEDEVAIVSAIAKAAAYYCLGGYP